MDINICTLVENTAGAPGLIGEWGQSLYVEADGEILLFDTGPSDLILHNAKKMGVDLSLVRKIVLSHGHNDHTGGLMNVILSIREKGFDDEIEIIGHPEIFNMRYTCIRGLPDRPIGMPYSREELEDLNVSFNLSSQSIHITENIITTGEVAPTNDFEITDPNLYKHSNGNLIPDDLTDDLSLIIKSAMGLIILFGCGHQGIINTIFHARKLTGIDKIYAVVGGIHLVRADSHQIAETVKALKNMDIQKIGVSHCTGLKPASILASEFGDKFFFNSAGTQTILSV